MADECGCCTESFPAYFHEQGAQYATIMRLDTSGNLQFAYNHADPIDNNQTSKQALYYRPVSGGSVFTGYPNSSIPAATAVYAGGFDSSDVIRWSRYRSDYQPHPSTGATLTDARAVPQFIDSSGALYGCINEATGLFGIEPVAGSAVFTAYFAGGFDEVNANPWQKSQAYYHSGGLIDAGPPAQYDMNVAGRQIQKYTPVASGLGLGDLISPPYPGDPPDPREHPHGTATLTMYDAQSWPTAINGTDGYRTLGSGASRVLIEFDITQEPGWGDSENYYNSEGTFTQSTVGETVINWSTSIPGFGSVVYCGDTFIFACTNGRIDNANRGINGAKVYCVSYEGTVLWEMFTDVLKVGGGYDPIVISFFENGSNIIISGIDLKHVDDTDDTYTSNVVCINAISKVEQWNSTNLFKLPTEENDAGKTTVTGTAYSAWEESGQIYVAGRGFLVTE